MLNDFALPESHLLPSSVTQLQSFRASMFRFISIALLIASLAGCASVSKNMSEKEKDQLVTGKTAVAFVDESNRIFYTEDHYLVFAIAQTASESVYEGIWDSSKDLSKVHSEQLGKLGLNAVSLYELFGEDKAKELIEAQRKSNQESRSKAGNDASIAPAFNPSLKDELLKKSVSNFVLIGWDGFHLAIPTLGLSPKERFINHYSIYNVPDGAVLFNGSMLAGNSVKIDKPSAKEFLEADQLSGLKAEATRLIVEKYTDPGTRGGTFSKAAGLEK